MFIDYNNIKDFVIEEIINNNNMNVEMLIYNLKKFKLFDIIINNLEIKKVFKNDNYVYNINIFGKNLGELKCEYYEKICSDNQNDILKQWIYDNLESYYSLIDNLLDYNSYNLINNQIDLSKISLHLYLIESIEFNEDYLKPLKIRKEVYYLQTMIGVYETEEYYDLSGYCNLNDFEELSKIINKIINISNPEDLKLISREIRHDNNRYKKVLKLEKNCVDKIKRK